MITLRRALELLVLLPERRFKGWAVMMAGGVGGGGALLLVLTTWSSHGHAGKDTVSISRCCVSKKREDSLELMRL
jgi:hypothetical protein